MLHFRLVDDRRRESGGRLARVRAERRTWTRESCNVGGSRTPQIEELLDLPGRVVLGRRRSSELLQCTRLTCQAVTFPQTGANLGVQKPHLT
jgi:hypothetical protein